MLLPLLLLTPFKTLDISAGSGVAKIGDRIFVVADDELHLTEVGAKPIPLFDGELPAEHVARKKQKPDLESLTAWNGNLLAFGSGSTESRMRGAWLKLTNNSVQRFDLAPLYAELKKKLPTLNIEGASVAGKELHLLQRGNGKGGVDAIVRLSLDAFEKDLMAGVITRASLKDITPIDLGSIDGVKLSFTDGTTLRDGRLVFVAAAESSPNTYEDGTVVATAVGVLRNGKVERLARMQPLVKIEGVHAEVKADGSIELLLVTDADDPKKPAALYTATLK